MPQALLRTTVAGQGGAHASIDFRRQLLRALPREIQAAAGL